MVSIYEYRSISTPRVMPPKEEKPPLKARIPYADFAKRENRAVLASWDRTASRFAGSKEAVAARRVDWLQSMPTGVFDRHAARASWDVGDSTADCRIDTLERAGLLRRVSGKPIKWERAE